MKKFRFTIFNLLGVAFLIGALYLGYGAVTEYVTDASRQDWTETTAVVTEIDSRQIRRSAGKHRTRYETVFDITYLYQVAEGEYTGQITGTSNFRVQGETVRIKYDPASPADSTATLQPSLYNLMVPLIAAFIFGIIGFFTSGLWALLRSRWTAEPEMPEPVEAYLPEEPVKPESVPTELAGKVMYHGKRILILVLFAACMVGFVKCGTSLGEKKEPVSADTVESLMLQQGYSPADATQLYAENWQVPLERVVCVHEDGLLMLFIQVEGVDLSTDLVNRLYSFSLDEIAPEPELEYRYTGNNFIVHAMEANEKYAMHIRVGETLAYVQCAESRAAEAVALLETIGYFN